MYLPIANDPAVIAIMSSIYMYAFLASDVNYLYFCSQ